MVLSFRPLTIQKKKRYEVKRPNSSWSKKRLPKFLKKFRKEYFAAMIKFFAENNYLYILRHPRQTLYFVPPWHVPIVYNNSGDVRTRMGKLPLTNGSFWKLKENSVNEWKGQFIKKGRKIKSNEQILFLCLKLHET